MGIVRGCWLAFFFLSSLALADGNSDGCFFASLKRGEVTYTVPTNGPWWRVLQVLDRTDCLGTTQFLEINPAVAEAVQRDFAALERQRVALRQTVPGLVYDLILSEVAREIGTRLERYQPNQRRSRIYGQDSETAQLFYLAHAIRAHHSPVMDAHFTQALFLLLPTAEELLELERHSASLAAERLWDGLRILVNFLHGEDYEMVTGSRLWGMEGIQRVFINTHRTNYTYQFMVTQGGVSLPAIGVLEYRNLRHQAANEPVVLLPFDGFGKTERDRFLPLTHSEYRMFRGDSLGGTVSLNASRRDRLLNKLIPVANELIHIFDNEN